MIEVPLPVFFYIPLGLGLLGLAAIWIGYTFRDILVARRRRIATRLYRCMVCSHVYQDARDVPLARCPRCATLNEAVRR